MRRAVFPVKHLSQNNDFFLFLKANRRPSFFPVYRGAFVCTQGGAASAGARRPAGEAGAERKQARRAVGERQCGHKERKAQFEIDTLNAIEATKY